MKYRYEDGNHLIITEGEKYFEYRLVYMKHKFCVQPNIEDWLVENIGHEGISWTYEYLPWIAGGVGYFKFNSKEDAMKFKLSWCE